MLGEDNEIAIFMKSGWRTCISSINLKKNQLAMTTDLGTLITYVK